MRLTVSCTTDELIFPFPRTYLNYIARDTSASLMPIPVICNPNNITDSIAVVIYELEAIDGGYTNFTQTDTFEIIYNNASRTSTGPDSYGYFMYDNTDTYSRRNPEYMWTELSGIGTRNRRLSSSENGVETISLPFDFRYYGLDYSEITITTEGYFTAGITYSCESYPEHIPFTSYPYPSVAIAWDDLYPIITGDIYTYYDEEHGKFLIQYDYITDSECNISTFEVAICDNEIYPTPTGDNEIYFYYQDSLFTSTKVVGIQNQSATSGLCYLENGEYNTSATNIVPETALRITTYPPDPDDVVNVYSTNYEISDLVGGDSDGRCEETETIDIIVLLENLGGLDAENIKVFLTTVEDRADIDIISDTVYVDGIDAESRLALPENLRFTFNSLDYDIDARFDIHVITNDGESCHIQPIYIPLREQLNIEDSQPTDYEIAKVYPNPFNSSINFELPSDRSIIEIYSTDGKLLERHTPSAHVYKLDWHSSEYSTGIYLYRIFSEKDEVSGKIVYIK